MSPDSPEKEPQGKKQGRGDQQRGGLRQALGRRGLLAPRDEGVQDVDDCQQPPVGVGEPPHQPPHLVSDVEVPPDLEAVHRLQRDPRVAKRSRANHPKRMLRPAIHRDPVVGIHHQRNDPAKYSRKPPAEAYVLGLRRNPDCTGTAATSCLQAGKRPGAHPPGLVCPQGTG